MEILATSLDSLLVPPGPAKARSHIYHFQLMMDYCWTHPNLELGIPENS